MSGKISVEATVAAKPARVWRLYTAPQHITGWNFASDDWHCPRAENDLRVGGRLCWRMEARDGSFGFDFEGIYNQLAAERLLAFSMPDGRQVKTSFVSLGDATLVRTSFDPDAENPAELQRAGWQAILDNFKRYAEASQDA